MKRICIVMACAVLFVGLSHLPVCAAQSTDPASFATVTEVPINGSPRVIRTIYAEVDNRSEIRITFDPKRMAEPAPLVPGGPARPQVHLRIEAVIHQGTSTTLLAPIPYYVTLSTATGKGSAVSPFVFHDKYFNPAIHAIPPNTEINLRGSFAASADYITLSIMNLETLQSVDYTLVPESFGFRPGVSDTLMFVRRLGISAADRAAGVDDVNFAPSPGVSYGGVYTPRGHGLSRWLSPGLAMNVLFLKWSDPAFDPATGKFTSGTKAGGLQVGMGVQGSLFSNILQFTYGWNLNVESNRTYVGIGMSFVNLTEKIGGLVSH